MSRSRSIAQAALAIWAVTALAAGCAGGPPGTRQTPPPLGPVTQVSSPNQVERPIAAYVLSAERIVDLLGVERSRIVRCIQRSDPTFVESTWATPSRQRLRSYFQALLGDDTRRSDLWGFFDPEGAPRGYARGNPALEALDYPSPPGVSEERVGECAADAHEGLPGNAAPIEIIGLRALPDGGPGVPVTDSRFVAAVAEWSACMRSAGFEYKDPLVAIAEQTRADVSDPVSQAAVASNDVRCKVETNLVGIGSAVQAAYDQRYIDAHRAELEARQNAIESYLRNAGSAG